MLTRFDHTVQLKYCLSIEELLHVLPKEPSRKGQKTTNLITEVEA